MDSSEKVLAMAEAVEQEANLEAVETEVEETPVVETPEPVEVKAETEKPSYLTDDEPIRVPVSALQKERQKRQELQRQLDELRRQPEPEPEVSLDLSGLEDAPDDFIDNKTAARLSKQAAIAGAKTAVTQVENKRQAEQQAAEIASRKNAIAQSEQKAREKFTDFDDVVGKAVEEGVFLPEEVASIRASANPGVVLYRKAKEALSMLGIEVKPLSKPNQESPEPEDDDDIYAQVFKKSG